MIQTIRRKLPITPSLSSPLNGSIIPLSLFLNAFITPLFVTPEWFCEGSTVLKTSGFPIKDFGNDEREVDASLNFRHEG